MTATQPDSGESRREHTWEGDPTQVFHCTTCGLVTRSKDTHFACEPRAVAPQAVPSGDDA